MSLSVVSQDVNGRFDLCLFFPAIESAGGTLYVQGWMYNKNAPGTPVDIEVAGAQPNPAVFPAELERCDVCDAFPDAPVHCGFSAYIPVSDESCLGSPIEVSYWIDGKKELFARTTAFNIDELIKQPELAAQLNPRQMARVRNMVRNERERIHKARSMQSRPLYLIIDPSFGCQLRCPYCHGDMVREAGVTMPIMREAMLDAILDRYGETLVQAHFFNWGEPLLNKRFPELVGKAHALDIWTTASTNFSLDLADDFLDAIIRSGLDLLIVSVDGTTQETYAQYRRGGNLSLVLENIAKLIERRRALESATPQIRFQFLDFPWTHGQIDEARRISVSLGADVFHVKGGCIHPRREIVNFARPQRQQLTRMAGDIQQNFRRLQQEKADKFQYFGCDHLYHQLSINSDGSVHPCCYVYEPGHTVGHAMSADDCFNGDIMQSNRAVFSSLEQDDVRGHDPCINCWIVGDAEARGHKESTITFQSAFEMVVKRPLAHFVPPMPCLESDAMPGPPPPGRWWSRPAAAAKRLVAFTSNEFL